MRYYWLATTRAGGLVVVNDDGEVVRDQSAPYFARAFGGQYLNDVVKRERDAGRKVAWMELEAHEDGPAEPGKGKR